jgi:uncharacterized membrane protein YagU involved in acid resistance
MKPNPSLVMVGGLLGTPVMTVLIYLLAPWLGVQTDIVGTLAEVLGGWKMGMLVHIFNGVVVFPLAYAFVAYRLFPGPPAAKGAAFGAGLWLVSQLIVLPLMGAGFFSANIGGVRASAVLLLGHIAYGGLLGAFAALAHEDLLPVKPKPAA